MPFIIGDAPPPAIIQRVALVQPRFGLSHSLVEGRSLVEYDRINLPRDFRDAKLEELLGYLPSDVRDMPRWALKGMLFTPIFLTPLVRTTTFITTTSATDQTLNPVLSDWNSLSNTCTVISSGSNGEQSGDEDGNGGGAGGGLAQESNVSLTPGGTATFRLRAGNVGAGTSAACWFKGTSLAAAAVGIECAQVGASSSNGRTGAITATAVGTIKRAGGNGGNGGDGDPCGASGGGGGGGAAATVGSAGANGTDGAQGPVSGFGGAGAPTYWDATHGPGNGGDGGQPGTAGGVYGGGGGGGDSGSDGGDGAQGLIVLVNN